MVVNLKTTQRNGCHCDLDPGMEPDGCVIDDGEPWNCIYAKDVEKKERCKYWKIIIKEAK